MNKDLFINTLKTYGKSNISALTTHIAGEVLNTKSTEHYNNVLQMCGWYAEFYETSDYTFKTLVFNKLKLRKEAIKQIKEVKVDQLVEELLEKEDRPVTILLENTYLSASLNNYLLEENLDLFTSKLRVISSTGTGKSLAMGGLNLTDTQSLLILKDNKALLENAYEDLRKGMEAEFIPRRELYMLHGEEKMTQDELRILLGKPNVILLATYNQLLRVDNLLVETKERVRTGNKLIEASNTRGHYNIKEPKKIVDWGYIVDEEHRLLTDGYRETPMIEVAAVLKEKAGYMTFTATAKTYSPLEYTREIVVKAADREIVGIVKQHKTETDLETLFKAEVLTKSDEKRVIFYFENDSARLLNINEELLGLGIKTAVITSDIFKQDRNKEGTLSFEVKNGRLGSLDCILSTVLLTEGVSFTEEYDEVNYYLNIKSEEDITHSLQIVQTAARARKVKKTPIINIRRSNLQLKNEGYEALAEFTSSKLVEKVDWVNESYIGIIQKLMEDVREGTRDKDDSEKCIQELKGSIRGDGYIIKREVNKETGFMIKDWVTEYQLVYTTVQRSQKNYELDVMLEGYSEKLFKTRMSRYGFDIEEVTEAYSVTKDVLANRKTKDDVTKEKIKTAALLKFKEHTEDLKKWLVDSNMVSKGTKAESKLAILVFYFLRIGMTAEETLEFMENRTIKQLEEIQREGIRSLVYYIELKGIGITDISKKLKVNFLKGDEKGQNYLSKLRLVEDLLQARGETIINREDPFKIIIEEKEWKIDLKLGKILGEFFNFKKKQYKTEEKRDERYYEITGYKESITKMTELDSKKIEELLKTIQIAEN